MTPKEEAQFIEKLRSEFVLIPKSRLYHIAGGAVAFLIVAFGVSIGSVMTYLRTKPAAIAQSEIERIRDEVQKHHKALGIGTFVRYDDWVQIESRRNPGRLLRNDHSNPNVVDARDAKEAGDNTVRWKIRAASNQ